MQTKEINYQKQYPKVRNLKGIRLPQTGGNMSQAVRKVINNKIANKKANWNHNKSISNQINTNHMNTNMNLQNVHSEFLNVLSSYKRNVAVPEYAVNAKIPSYSPLPTNAFHMKTTIKFNTSAVGTGPGGEAAIVINPYFLCEDSNAVTNILINNGSALNTTTAAGANGFASYSMGSRLTANTTSAYRLVSASLHIYPEVSALNAQGYIAGGVVTYTGQPDSYPTVGTGQGPFGAASVTASILDQAMFYNKAQIGGQNGIRIIYTPFDPSFEFFCQPGKGRTTLLSTNCDQFYWNFYITGTVASSPMVIDLYYNFELEPLPAGVLQCLATKRLVDESEKGEVKLMTTHPEMMSQSNSNLLQTAQTIDSVISTGSLNSGKKLGFMDKTLAFLSNNSANILNILSTTAKLF